MDLRGDPPGSSARDELAQLFGLGVPDAAPEFGRERPVGFGLDVGEQRGRPGPERAVGEALLPADPCTTGRVPTQERAAGQVLLEGCIEGLRHERGQDPHWKTACLGKMRIRRERPTQVRVVDDPARIVDRHYSQCQQVVRDPDDRRFEIGHGHVRDVDRNERARALEQDALGFAVGGTADDTAGWIGRRAIDGGDGQRGSTREQGMMVVCPQRASASRCDALEVDGSRPATPAVRIPAVPLEPRVGGAQGSVRGADPFHPRLERRRAR